MKKIGVLTTSSGKGGRFGCNYGAALQGFALVKQLRILGFEAYDINYVSHNEYHPASYNVVERTLRRIPLLFNKKLVMEKLRHYKYRNNLNSLHNVFSNFVKSHELTYNNGQFYNIEELEKISNEFYAFICGSDVVWNPYLRQNKNDEGYFLNFVTNGVKRIAYAPSMGVTELPDESKKNLKELLLKFDALSIREESGSNLIKKETGIDVPVVLDPTLLLDPNEYNSIMIKPEKLPDHYIVVYKFGDLESTIKSIELISRKLKLPVIYIPSSDNELGKARYDIGPGEFIGVIKNADLVLSDSFHCTVFSLISHTPFLTFYRNLPSKKANLNSRMIDLLNMVEMQDKMIAPDDTIDFSKIFECDFNKSDKILSEKRKESLKYLKTALEII